MFTYYWWQISSDDSDRENSGEKNSNEENIYIYIYLRNNNKFFNLAGYNVLFSEI